ncbi:phosphoenolpyruvate--protein phosphotransferase (plasmid) [Microvirga ossetica]|uniref:Phosphoenolpyruvate-protein phosphotransferase n=1 Tax=Microvirga ossetica TaxID=1882682 RepID=A0A1B2ES81_9HYPH|nr:phosphoenolpyruvate--protein phosphotransferase [Microvirga ossetica]ANY82819.1 phosphoenolpyruvate--protein phosphotransferase [Microvirga ossetica]ANY84618.1 phosphoenolpyruvate--protein phosphotransferase [Microvirga ossetica]
MPATRLVGRPTAPGLARGPVALLDRAGGECRVTGDPAFEASALRMAIRTAIETLNLLAAEAGDAGAEILGFQIAMLEDDALSADAFAEIAAGIPADHAWRRALDREIAGYTASEDEYFRARATDLEDMRDRVLDALTGAGTRTIPPGSVVFADNVTPSRFLATDWTGGAIVLAGGSPTSHVATLARGRGVPMVVGVRISADALGSTPSEAIVDGATGLVLIGPDAADLEAFRSLEMAAADTVARHAAYRLKPAVTADGTPIAVQVNIADPAELDALDLASCDGIGLVRTELLFGGRGLPDEEHQVAIYRRIVEWASGKPVIIRTLDAGGDKPIPGLTENGETNPFLGLRGVRLTLKHLDLFRTQLRALARAAAYGGIEIMVPMVTVREELSASRALLDEAVASLSAEGLPHRRPPLGMMVEVPAAAIAIDLFDADFFSIGSNDLTQYVTAASRDTASVVSLADPAHPAVLRLIEEVAAHGARSGRKVSLCGDAGADPRMLPLLLRRGLRTVSVAPTLVATTKAAIAAIDLRDGER